MSIISRVNATLEALTFELSPLPDDDPKVVDKRNAERARMRANTPARFAHDPEEWEEILNSQFGDEDRERMMLANDPWRRVLSVLVVHNRLHGNFYAPCPVCQRDIVEHFVDDAREYVGTFAEEIGAPAWCMHIDRDTPRARCENGCTSETIAEALTEIVPHVEANRREQHTPDDDVREQPTPAEIAEAYRITDETMRHDCIVDGVVPEQALVMPFGKTENRKTFLGQSLAVSIATGTPWLGRAVHRTGRVAGVYMEGSEKVRNARFARFALACGTTYRELQARQLMPNYTRQLQTAEESSVRDYVAWLRKFAPIASVIDSASKLGAINFSDPASVLKHIEPLALISQGKMPGLPAIPHILITHSNSTDGIRGGDPMKQDADLVWHVVADSDAYDSVIRMTPGKDRYSIRPQPIALRLVDRDDGALWPELAVPHAKRKASAAPKLPARQTEILDVLRVQPGLGLNAISRETGRSDKHGVKADLTALIGAGHVRVDADKLYWPVEPSASE